MDTRVNLHGYYLAFKMRRAMRTILQRKQDARGTSRRYLRLEPILPGTSGHDFYVPTSKYFGHQLRELRKTRR